MAKKEAIDLAMQGVNRAFKSLEQEVKGFRTILDVSPRTLNRLLKDKSKARQLKRELVDTIGHPYVGAEDNFLAVTTPQKLNKAKAIISRFTTDNTSADKLSVDKLSSTRQRARNDLIMKKSNSAGARLGVSVSNYIRDINKFTSPKLISELRSSVSKKADTITLTMDVPKGKQFERAEVIAQRALKEGINYGTSDDIQDIMKTKTQLIADTARKGKSAVRRIIRTRERKKAAKISASKQTYYVPSFTEADLEEQSMEDFKELRATMLFTLNSLIANTVGNPPHMQHSSAPPSLEYLRYQTGRFSDSVEIEYVDPSLNIGYRYMTWPYRAAFGGQGGRDPDGIISGAIREIMINNFTNEIIGNVHSVI